MTWNPPSVFHTAIIFNKTAPVATSFLKGIIISRYQKFIPSKGKLKTERHSRTWRQTIISSNSVPLPIPALNSVLPTGLETGPTAAIFRKTPPLRGICIAQPPTNQLTDWIPRSLGVHGTAITMIMLMRSESFPRRPDIYCRYQLPMYSVLSSTLRLAITPATGRAPFLQIGFPWERRAKKC